MWASAGKPDFVKIMSFSTAQRCSGGFPWICWILLDFDVLLVSDAFCGFGEWEFLSPSPRAAP
jgi:hypothetical protein